MPERRTVTRSGYTFDVEDGPITESWDFWGLWARGDWEGRMIAVMDEVMPVGGTLLDVGAWIGPWTLWAAARWHPVIALEPDGDAFMQLSGNVKANRLEGLVHLMPVAAGLRNGHCDLWAGGDKWGNSTSSTQRETGPKARVSMVDLAALIRRRRPSVVKIDIEGGEAELMPTIGPAMREVGCSLLLSTHAWAAPEHIAAMNEELCYWTNVEPIEDGQFLCRNRKS